MSKRVHSYAILNRITLQNQPVNDTLNIQIISIFHTPHPIPAHTTH